MFEVGKKYQSNESTSFVCEVVKRTKCFVTVKFFIDESEDWMFKGDSRYKVQNIKGQEYFDTALHSYFSNPL